MNELNDRIIRIIEEADSLYHDGRYAEAIECYERAAASDPKDTDALYMLYRLYRFGLHDYVSAEKTLLLMIALKPSLRYEYADMLLDGRSSVRDAERAAEMLVYVREHADLKDESENTTYNLATKLLGDCYRRGRGVPRDTERAIALYEEAAEDGNVPARHILALLAWARGDGHETLRRLGMSDHKMSDGLSLALIGMILNDSPFSDVATDRRSAAKFFEAAAENGNAYAMCATGDNYRLSNFFGHDPAAAAYWYRQGALKGDIPAANNYGACWEHAYGVPRSYRAAAFMYELAGDAGFATATSNLARATERGRGLPADEEKAFGLYKKAALSDEPDGSMYNDLGACYKMEIGTAPDGEKEYAAFRLGTVAGDRNALHGYVMCLAAGEGVPEDLVKAEYLMSGMVRYGNYSGYCDLAYMFSHYPEDPAARRKTFEYYKLGAAHGDTVLANYGYIYNMHADGTLDVTAPNPYNIYRITENGVVKAEFFYDELGRLSRENNAYTNQTVIYTYDSNNNILSKTVYAYTSGNSTPSGVTVTTYTYGDSIFKDRLTAYDGQSIIYDNGASNGIGLPTTYLGKTMTWEGRELVSVVDDGGSIAYSYDLNGLRLSKSVNGIVTEYLYSGTRLLRQVTGGNVIWFIYDQDGMVGFELNGTPYYYLRNLLSDVAGIIDTNGNVVVNYTYDSWGKLISVTGSQADTVGALNPIRYRGYYYDAETGFYYLNSRYYDAETGRFISPDVLSEDGNLYSYCQNDPINRSDESGYLSKFWKRIIKIAVGVVATVAAVAITVATGGAALPVVAGVVASTVIGGVINGAVQAANGGDFSEGFLDGAADGLMWGGTFALGGSLINAAKAVGSLGKISSTTQATSIFPPNNGFASSPKLTTITKGSSISRYGSTTGKYVTIPGTTPNQLSLPPMNNGKLTNYTVVKNIHFVKYGTAAPWFGCDGGGTQFLLRKSVQWYLDHGYIILG